MSTGVTHWIGRLKAGDAAAAQPLWERYFKRLVGLARARLQGARRRAADEEDVALSVFDSVFRGAERGRFPQLTDRNDLWKLLVVITARKAADLKKHERRLKRGGGKVSGESALVGADGPEEQRGIEGVVGAEPTPELAAQVAEECERLLAALGDQTLRSITLWKMEGHTNREIAEKLGRSVSTVELKLAIIRKTWATDGQPAEVPS